MKKTIKIVAVGAMLAPLSALAQTSSVLLGKTSATFASLEKNIISDLNLLVPVLAGLAIVFFFWGLIGYIYNSGDAKGRAAGRDAIIWGLVGLLIIFALGGILQLLQTTLLQ